MKQYFSAEIWRTFRNPYLYTGGAAAVVLIFAGIFLTWLFDPLHSGTACDTVLLSIVSYLPTVGVYLIAVIAGIIFSGEHKNRTLRNTVSRGTPRSTVYLGKFFTLILFCLLFLLAALAESTALGLLFFGPGDTFPEAAVSLFLTLAGAIPLWIACAAILTALSANIPSDNQTGAVYFTLFLVPFFLVDVFKLPSYRPVWKMIDSILIYSRLLELSRGAAIRDVTILYPCWALGLVCTVTALGIGGLFFRRKEIL